MFHHHVGREFQISSLVSFHSEEYSSLFVSVQPQWSPFILTSTFMPKMGGSIPLQEGLVETPVIYLAFCGTAIIEDGCFLIARYTGDLRPTQLLLG